MDSDRRQSAIRRQTKRKCGRQLPSIKQTLGVAKLRTALFATNYGVHVVYTTLRARLYHIGMPLDPAIERVRQREDQIVISTWQNGL